MELPSAEQARASVHYAQSQAALAEFDSLVALISRTICQNKLSVWVGPICAGNVSKLRGKGYKVTAHHDERNETANEISWA